MSTQACLIERALPFIFQQSHVYLQRLNWGQYCCNSPKRVFLPISIPEFDHLNSCTLSSDSTWWVSAAHRPHASVVCCQARNSRNIQDSKALPISTACLWVPGLAGAPFVLLTSCTDHLDNCTTTVTTSSELQVNITIFATTVTEIKRYGSSNPVTAWK